MVSRRIEALLDQLRQQGIDDELLLKAIGDVPRERFVDEALAHKAGKYVVAHRLRADHLAALYGSRDDLVAGAEAGVARAGNRHRLRLPDGYTCASGGSRLLRRTHQRVTVAGKTTPEAA